MTDLYKHSKFKIDKFKKSSMKDIMMTDQDNDADFSHFVS